MIRRLTLTSRSSPICMLYFLESITYCYHCVKMKGQKFKDTDETVEKVQILPFAKIHI
jgi:hypothetical protein